MLHVISTRCVARDLRTIGHLCGRVGDSSWRSEEIVKKKSEIAAFSLIIIIIIIH